MKTIYLPWTRPVLLSAAEYLVDVFAKNGRLDLRNVLIALPGARAAARLEELLLDRVERKIEEGSLDSAWYPPRLLTIGRLPELLYPQKQPFADDLTQQFAWIAALDEMQKNEPDVLFHLFHEPPDMEDITARLALAKVFSTVHRELAAETLQFDDVQGKCVTIYHGRTAESIRWQTLARLQKKYLDILNELKLWDVQTARIFAIRNAEPKTDQTIVLVGTVDMNRAQKKILDFVSDNVISLVFAPPSHQPLFDAYGCLLSKKWKDVPIPLDDDQIEVVDTPSDQATAAARWIASKTETARIAEEITLCVPSESVIPLVRQQFLQAGAETRAVGGLPFSRTSPYKFLELVARLVKTRQYSGFADLLRHPAVESFLVRENPERSFELLATEADRYHAEFLPSDLNDDWRQYVDPQRPPTDEEPYASLRDAWDSLKAVLAPFFQPGRFPSSLWCERLSPIPVRFFEHAIPELDALLEKIAGLPQRLVREFDASEFLAMVLRELESIRVPPPAEKNAIEILGWLDLPMDDAPIAVLTCMNEGVVPSSLTSDLFLPDGIRAALEIEDNDRRFARDAYALSVIVATKSNPDDVKLIAGRRDTEGNPLLPSRLLFADEPDVVAQRVKRFFQVEERATPVVFPGTFRAARKEAAFKPPDVRRPLTPVRSMRVTEFKDYLACPYRYYLRHRLKLDVLHDHDEELDAAKFGNVLHEVLRRFGIGDARNSADRGEITAFLDGQLDKIAAEIFGEHPRAVVAIQMEQLRHRLGAFATWQADWVSRGNRIRFAELNLNDEATDAFRPYLDLDDGRRMNLRGRIDRIDVNSATGRGWILDYKSSDTAKKPEKAHVQKGKWIDLQLPLYRHVIRQSREMFPEIRDWTVGYIVLPKDVSKTGVLEAAWSESDYAAAMETAYGVVRDVWDEKFGPEYRAKTPPAFTEIYAAICRDR